MTGHRRWVVMSAGAVMAFGRLLATMPESDPDTLERGRYLATAGNCVTCHSGPHGQPFAGGVAFHTPFGTIYSTNITPDTATGIGRWSETDFIRALREGVRADGRRLFPAFPYPSFTKLSDGDAKALYRYLRTLTPVRYVPPGNSFLFRQRWVMFFWNAFWFKPQRYVPVAGRSAQWNRGAYLSEALGHCDACHTPRNLFMAEIPERAYAGGELEAKVADDSYHRWSSVNLTPSPAGIGPWSVEELTRYLKTGFSQRGGACGPMNEVIVNSTRNLSDADVHAMAVYFKALPVQATEVAHPPTDSAMKAGEAIYNERCKECHLASGRGGLFSGPRLAGSAVVQAPGPASLLNIILYGPDPPAALQGAGPHWETMRPYKQVLSDEQIAAVSNFVRNSWGNRGDAVTAAEVARQR
jgi:mono/diheme cytochrome c family protein